MTLEQFASLAETRAPDPIGHYLQDKVLATTHERLALFGRQKKDPRNLRVFFQVETH